MSTIKVTNINNASATSGGIALDSSGHVQVDGVQMPTAGALSSRNKIINGAMTIDQRNAGAAVTVNNLAIFYGADRYRAIGQSSAGVFTLQQTSDAPASFVNSLKVTVTTADASIATTDRYIVQQVIEGNNASDLSFGTADASTVAISFWVKSSLTGSFGGCLQNNAPDRSYPFTYTINAANTWEYKTIIISGDTTGTWATDNTGWGRLTWSIGTGADTASTAGSWQAGNFEGVTGQVQLISTLNATWQITGVQLEVGEKATPFEHRSYGDELARCQRYYETYSTNDNNRPIAAFYSTVNANCYIPFKVTKRAAPTVAIPTLGSVWNGAWRTVSSASATPSGSIGDTEGASFELVASTAGSAGYAGFARNNNFTFDSEL